MAQQQRVWAIIGGTGFEKFDDFTTESLLDIETPFGPASRGLKRVRIASPNVPGGHITCLFVPRHGDHHDHLPSEVNYRANIWALKKYGATNILAINAVGSLKQEHAPGHCVVPNQYVNKTLGLRNHTFCGKGVVGHISLAHPTCSAVASMVSGLVAGQHPATSFGVHMGGSCVVIEGPAFSTYAECMVNVNSGFDVVGMTAFPEYALAREAGLCYTTLAFVTDYDCWDLERPHVTVAEVMTVMRNNNIKAFSLVRAILEVGTVPSCPCAASGLASGLMTPRDHVPAEWGPVLFERQTP